MYLILLHVITILILIGAAIIFIIKATINALFNCQCAVQLCPWHVQGYSVWLRSHTKICI